MASSTRVAVVSGSNRGIGLSVVRGLLKSDKFADGDVFVTARDEAKGKEAMELLHKEGLTRAKFHQLDINDEESVKRLASFLKEKYGGIDILVNNAAIAFKRAAMEPFGHQAEESVRVNYWSTKRVCEILFPLLRPGARVVNVSSLAGLLKEVLKDGTELKQRLSSSDLTVEELNRYMKEFVEVAKAGKHEEKGWPNSAYGASKVGLSALTIIQQREFDKDPSKDIVINHIHPGLVQTGMSSGTGNRTPDEGAESTLFAALLPPKTDIRAKFIHDDCTLVEWAGKKECQSREELMARYHPKK